MHHQAPPAKTARATTPARDTEARRAAGRVDREARRKKAQADRRRSREQQARQQRVDDLECRIGEREEEIKKIEATMSAPGFYSDRETAQPVINRHQNLMWEVGDLMSQWEELQEMDYSKEGAG